MRNSAWLWVGPSLAGAVVLAAANGCSSSTGDAGSGGTVGTGGAAPASGGAAAAPGLGGSTASGGFNAAGQSGSPATGGVPTLSGGSGGGGGAPVTGGVATAGGGSAGTSAGGSDSGGAGASGCAPPMSSCSGTCVDTKTDAANCGTCGNACPAGRPCADGMCQCPTGQAFCNGACVDVQSDVKNCGTCGNECMPGIPCQSGMCTSGGMCTSDNNTFSGHITWYTLATEMVACHYPTSSLPQYYGAMNTADYKAAAVCGACVEITNQQNGKKLNVLIADECPEASNKQWCYTGSHHIDLIKPAYDALQANNNPAISWKFVPCTPNGGVSYYFDKASKEGYLAVSPMNHRHRVTKMEVQDPTGAFIELKRSMYNMWETTAQLGPGPYTFRVTDIYNHVIQDGNIALKPAQVVAGVGQFSSCTD